MQAIAENGLMLALFNPPGFEIILILAPVIILFGATKLPEMSRGLGQGLFEFLKATKKVADEIDDEASEAGRSVGGIYGKPAAQALTLDNQVAEIYKPAVFETEAENCQVRLTEWPANTDCRSGWRRARKAGLGRRIRLLSRALLPRG